MKRSITYNVIISWTELIDFLDEKYLELLCQRLHVSRDKLRDVPFILSHTRDDALLFFNEVECE